MSPASLLQQFEVIADAPGGVQRLREIILGLAFRGGLSANSTRGSQIPDGWTIASVGSLSSEIVSGFACNKKNEDPNGYVHLRTHNVGVNGKLNFDLLVRIAQDKVHPDRAELRAGDVLFNNTNSQELVGKTCLVDQDYDFAFSNHLTRIRLKPTVSPAYFVYYFNFLLRLGYFAQICNRWIGQAGINTKMLAEIEVPVAPKDEQRRIVAKVDQLMALCDELEERHRRRAEKRVSLNRSALHHLTTATDGAELYDHWRRVRDHFDLLYEVPETVAELRQAILQLAVRGKLVPQDPSDEPASVLLERIEAEKQGLYAAGKIREPKKLPPVEADEVPFEVPEGWEWVRIGAAMELINGRAFKPAEWSTTGLRIVRIQNLNDENAPFNYCDFLVKEKFYINDGDLLVSWSGTPGTSFGAFVWRRGPAVLNQHIFRCEIFGKAYDKDFARLAINARLDEMIEQAHGGVGLRHITKGKLEALAIVLPPLPEQRRIVEKVDELMALCDDLEERLLVARTRAESVAAAVVHQLTAA